MMFMIGHLAIIIQIISFKNRKILLFKLPLYNNLKELPYSNKINGKIYLKYYSQSLKIPSSNDILQNRKKSL